MELEKAETKAHLFASAAESLASNFAASSSLEKGTETGLFCFGLALLDSQSRNSFLQGMITEAH